MSIQVAHLELDAPVLLAPMAGITDLPFRNIVQKFGAGLVVSEMVASQEMVQAKPGVRERAELGLQAENTAIQLAGREAHWMAEAARVVEGQGAAIIDINMGCPARKVTNGMSGSALMRDLDHAMTLIMAVIGAVDIPVTVKMRLGWDDNSMNAPELARRAEAAGVAMITVHGRTRCQFYKGQADWAAIARVKDAVDIPVIANGDITDAASARQALKLSGADGVMVGRGIQGRPWMLAEIGAAVFDMAAPVIPIGQALVVLVAEHYRAALDFYGPHLGNRVMRKHLGWYMADLEIPPLMRHAILSEPNPQKVLDILPDAMGYGRRSAA
ncbi:MAG: tRNA dihydrouridine synthase DusB [Paracoccaceae bacterium]